MKKLAKLKLKELADVQLNERGMSRILGGGTPGLCQCGCIYAKEGGSSTGSNDSANTAGGLHSTVCPKPEPTNGGCTGVNFGCPPIW